MKPRLVWSLLLALALAAGLMAWLTPSAQGEHSRAPKTIRQVQPPPTGVDSGDCSGFPCATIGYAISQSGYGDRINVASGWYTEHITMADGVSIYGQGWSSTIITGNFFSPLSTVLIPWTVGASTVLSGVQIAGGGTGDPYSSPYGGGIRIEGSPTIYNTWVKNNTGYYGGGVWIGGGSPTLNNVPVWNNRAVTGGGFYLTCCTVVTITSDWANWNGTVWFNSADMYGGGVHVVGGVTATLTGLRIWFNNADYGGGIAIYYNSSSRIVLQGNDITSNAARSWSGGGIYTEHSSNLEISDNWINLNSAPHKGGGMYLNQTAGRFKNNLLVGNIVTASGSSGGGAYVTGSSTGLTLEGNWFEGNFAGYIGGGMDIGDGAVALVNANTIVTNTAWSGAGVSVSNAGALTFTNNIVARNIITYTGVLGLAGGLNVGGTPARVINNTISGNAMNGLYFYTSNGIVIMNNIISGNDNYGIERADSSTYTADYNDVYSNSSGGYSGLGAGTHDQTDNPLFIGTGNIFNYYHIQAASPVSTTGSLALAPLKDIDGDIRLFGGSVSRGADEIPSTGFNLFLPLILR